MGEAYAGRALDIRRFRYDSKRRLHLGKLWGVKENPCFYVAMVAFPCADTTTFAMIQNGEEKHYPNKAAHVASTRRAHRKRGPVRQGSPSITR